MSSLEVELAALKKQLKVVFAELVKAASTSAHSNVEDQSELEQKARYAASVFSRLKYGDEEAWSIQIITQIYYGKTEIRRLIDKLESSGDIEFCSNIENQPETITTAKITARHGSISFTVEEAYLIAQSLEGENSNGD